MKLPVRKPVRIQVRIPVIGKKQNSAKSDLGELPVFYPVFYPVRL